MTAGTEATKELELKEPEHSKIRFFNDESVKVEIPEAYRELFEDAPSCIVITAMTPTELDKRRSLKANIQREQDKANHKAGIKKSETTAFNTYYSELKLKLDLLQNDVKKYSEVYSGGEPVDDIAEVRRLEQECTEKYGGLLDKKTLIDKDGVEQAYDNLRENTYEMFEKHLISIDWEKESIKDINPERLRPEFISFCISSIEEESSLTSSEALGL